MPRIFDNIEQTLLPALQQTLEVANHADFCVGYFNLRGWKQLDSYIDKWAGGEGNCCRLLVGMQHLPQEELRTAHWLVLICLSVLKDAFNIKILKEPLEKCENDFTIAWNLNDMRSK